MIFYHLIKENSSLVGSFEKTKNYHHGKDKMEH
jgi:hypothetical protein